MAKSNSEVAARRMERWRKLLERWRASGLSQAEFCRRRGIPVSKFAWWKRRLSVEGAARPVRRARPGREAAADCSFVPVQVVAALHVGDLELTLGGGRVLRFGADVDAGKLAAIVAALEASDAAGDSGRRAEGPAGTDSRSC